MQHSVADWVEETQQGKEEGIYIYILEKWGWGRSSPWVKQQWVIKRKNMNSSSSLKKGNEKYIFLIVKN